MMTEAANAPAATKVDYVAEAKVFYRAEDPAVMEVLSAEAAARKVRLARWH
jgi:hypothetical protein